MENSNNVYIGAGSCARTCKVCMRTKEEAIAEQLQKGGSCGHENCTFKTEMELVFSIMKVNDIEHISDVTSESIDLQKKTYELLLNLRQKVRFLQERIPDQSSPENSDIRLQSVHDRIGQAIRLLSQIIEKKGKPVSELSRNMTSETEHEQIRNEFNEYIKWREQRQQKVDKIFASLDSALAGMRQCIAAIKEENDEDV